MKKVFVRSLVSLFITASLLQMSCQSFVNSLKETKEGTTDIDTTAAEIEPAPRSSQEAVAVEQEERADETPFLADSSALIAAERSLRDRPELRGQDIFIYRSVHFYDDGRISLKVQHPQQKNYVDSYDYRDGKWSDPSPVVLSKRDIVAKDIVSLNSLPFKTANQVFLHLKEKLQQIGSRSEDYTVYAITSGNEIRWYPRTISNERSKYSIEFNADGTIRSFEQE
ncbi:hypothetical protein [Sphingobacterium bambusae]|uniref:Beta-lactamase-inhibitor-like PepSY-like domain-containing protein n=1 Tax=Sphingobacterium bambusae TaxID=662858 RepID=A0ABW6BP22_9SPHI|nr:hypothetical protein [Sphingobacterium bambusae]WPL46677.1 hypothetical protein SCB77_11925 [Sphingobacterium bambusae]